MNERHHTASFLLVVALGLCLYLPLLTRNYDINGLAEAAAVESGNPVDLWNPNHMLYRPVGYLVRQSSREPPESNWSRSLSADPERRYLEHSASASFIWRWNISRRIEPSRSG